MAFSSFLLLGFLVLSSLTMADRRQQWMTQYEKAYTNLAEKEKRFNIFKANVEFIESFSRAGSKPYKLSVNEFTDLTSEEFRSNSCHQYQNITAVPSSAMDWRKKGAVTPIKDQGQCGTSSQLNPVVNMSSGYKLFSCVSLF
ncbi:hypothetical protein MKX03_034495 [Papaver bracteatum]|nr:hypothetical protein MKX03_034495 [Papaver bracteatum]